MPFSNSRKRKLYIKDFSKCNPKTKSRKNTCLPSNIYNQISRDAGTGGNMSNTFTKLGCGVGDEHCLLDKAAINDDTKKQLRKQYLRPRYPKAWLNDPDMWLDNYNIAAVMKQYQEAIPSFKFLGVFPIDFSAPNPYVKSNKPVCLYNDLCTINLKKEYSKGIRGIGAIFNLDPHFKGGSHWVGLFINIKDINKPSCSYFDSYGYKTPPLIARLMKSLRLQNPDIELGFNARRFQYGGSECGMFSMYFLICMLYGIPFKEFCKDSVNDKMMLELRHILFAK